MLTFDMAKVRGLHEFMELARTMGIPEPEVLAFAEKERKLELEIYEGERADRVAERKLKEAQLAADQTIALAKIAADRDIEFARLEAGQITSPGRQIAASPEPFHPSPPTAS